MIKRIDEIRDDEIRVIGPSDRGKSSSGRNRWLIIALILIGCIILGLLLWKAFTPAQEIDVPGVFEPENTILSNNNTIVEPVEFLGDYSEITGKAYTEHLRQTINDIPLDIYIPHNAKPCLSIGTPDIHDNSIVFVTQAADIRADNGKINGAFVLAGQPMAWGLSKKGYVGIINDTIKVGVADNSPLFEEATEKGGYFFRQYALVDNGVLVENEPKNKSIRKAICDRGGEIMVIMSETPESFHDFAQALVDLRVDNAVYLVGADSYGYFRDKYDHFTQICEKRRGGYKYENYIKWVK